MAAIQRYKGIILISAVLIILFASWPYFIKDRFLSMSTQSIEINDLETAKKIRLKKHSGQGYVHGLELEIQGNTDRTLMLMMGDCDSIMNQVIQLKKGRIDFNYTGDWYADNCYIFLPSDQGTKVNLQINYRFLSLR